MSSNYILFCFAFLIFSSRARAKLIDNFNEIISNDLLNNINASFIQPRQNPGCSFSYVFDRAGQTAILQSPTYPSEYPSNLDCRYTISSPVGTQMRLQCDEFNVESSANCQYDMFNTSLSGDSSFRDREFFCGQGTLSRQTSGNQLALGFKSDSSNPQSSTPFRFQCQISVISTSPPCSCGIRNSASARIVGGSVSGVNEFPWRCALYSQRLGVFCGCTIISRNYVLSAAHCTANVLGDQIYVDVGDHDLSSNTEAQNQAIPVANIIQNSQYNEQTQDSDIALLRLSTPLTFSRTVSPICLPWHLTTRDITGFSGVTSGWGTTFQSGPISSVLRKVDLPIISGPECASRYIGTDVVITDNKICTFSPGRDTCQGDSGGSLDLFDNGKYYAVGITSEGLSCGGSNSPGVFTKVTNFLNWIQGMTGETFCRG